MIDFGVGVSVGRLYGKAVSKNQTEAQAILTNCTAVLLVQACGIIVVGLVIGAKIGEWFGVEEALQQTAFIMLSSVCVAGAVRQVFRVKDAYLFSLDKYYIVNWIGAGVAWLELAVLWICLAQGLGLLSFIFSQVTLISATVIALSFCAKRNAFKNNFRWHEVKFSRIKEIFSFSISMFVIGIFGQLLFVGQPLVVGYLHGLDATTRFSINTRAGMFVRMLLSRVLESFLPSWQIKFDQRKIGEVSSGWSLQSRRVVGFGLVGFTCLVAGNETFTTIFSSSELYLSPIFDVANSAFTVLHLIIAGLTFPFILSMKVRLRAVVSVVQMSTAFPLAVIMGKSYGPTGVVLGMMIGIVVTGGVFNFFMSPRLIDKSSSWLAHTIFLPNLFLFGWCVVCATVHIFMPVSAAKLVAEILICLVAALILLRSDKSLYDYLSSKLIR